MLQIGRIVRHRSDIRKAAALRTNFQNVAGAQAEYMIDTCLEPVQYRGRHERLDRPGKAAAVHAAGSLSVKKLFGDSERKRHVLMNGIPVLFIRT